MTVLRNTGTPGTPSSFTPRFGLGALDRCDHRASKGLSIASSSKTCTLPHEPSRAREGWLILIFKNSPRSGLRRQPALLQRECSSPLLRLGLRQLAVTSITSMNADATSLESPEAADHIQHAHRFPVDILNAPSRFTSSGTSIPRQGSSDRVGDVTWSQQKSTCI